MANSEVLRFNLPVYTTRWGHDDMYTLTLAQVYMELHFLTETAICRWTTAGAVWQGKPNSLEYVLGRDSVNFPKQFKTDLRQNWLHWRSEKYDDVKVIYKMEQLFDWLNQCTKADEHMSKLIEAGEADEWEA